MRASRLLSILILLQLRPRITAEALAREFEVSVRTVHRDIDALSAAGVPVYGDRGPGGGFALHGGFRTRLTGVLDDEAQALPLLSLPGVAGELGLGAAPRRLQHKLMAALPADAATLAGRLQQRLHVDPLDWYHESLPVPHLPALARAALDNRRVRVQYDSWSGRRHWTVDPLGLVLKAGSWYAVVRQGTRTLTLKVAALVELQALDDTFERPEPFDLADWWQRSTARFERELRPQQALLRATPEGCRRLAEGGAYAARAVAAAVPEAQGDWAQLTLPVESTEQAARLVLSLAPEVQALQPADLRARVAALAADLARQHRVPSKASKASKAPKVKPTRAAAPVKPTRRRAAGA